MCLCGLKTRLLSPRVNCLRIIINIHLNITQWDLRFSWREARLGCDVTSFDRRYRRFVELGSRMFRIQKVETASSSGALVHIYQAMWRVFCITQFGYFTTIHHVVWHMVRNTAIVNDKSKYWMYCRSLYKNCLFYLFWKSQVRFSVMRRNILRNSFSFPPTCRKPHR
jgi:hypothetical protein